MEVCVLVLGTDPKRGARTAEAIGERIMARNIEYSGMLPIVVMGPEGMDMVLKFGMPLPEAYNKADRKLLLGIDSTSTAYLDEVGDNLVRAYKRGASADGMPQILQMSDAVRNECWRQRLNRVWIQDSSQYATEQRLGERLSKAGIGVQQIENLEATVSLLRTMSELGLTTDPHRIVSLVNECREKLCLLAQEANAEAVILDQMAYPFLEARKLTAEWGPTVIDAYGLYLDAAAEWVEKATRGELLTDRWLKSDGEFFGDSSASDNQSPPPQLTKVSKAKASGRRWRLFDSILLPRCQWVYRVTVFGF